MALRLLVGEAHRPTFAIGHEGTAVPSLFRCAMLMVAGSSGTLLLHQVSRVRLITVSYRPD
jgi:hypothetical protein